ncbi:MAG: tyrosine-type recombinase/integrase [Planctomycetota bacterium]
MGKRGSWRFQIDKAFKRIDRIGHSRHQDKTNGRGTDGIYSSRTWHDYREACRGCAEWAKREYGIRTDIRLLTPEIGQAYLDHRAKQGVSGGTLGRIKAALVKLSVALYGQEGKWTLAETWHSDRRPEKAYTPQQARQIEASVRKHARDPQTADVVKLASIGGLRRQEAVSLRGQDINVERCTLTLVKDTKGGKVRTVRIDPKHREYLAKLKRQAAGHNDGSVFRGRGGLARRVENAVAAACKRLGIARKGVHAFRKTWAQERYRVYREQGLSDAQARRKLSRGIGHRRIDVTYHYVPRQA